MVDDILAVQKCSNGTIEIDVVINAFVESKKLKLSKSKCHKIPISTKIKCDEKCAKLKVHRDEMNDSPKQKYLEDIVDSSGKRRNAIEDRKKRLLDDC